MIIECGILRPLLGQGGQCPLGRLPGMDRDQDGLTPSNLPPSAVHKRGITKKPLASPPAKLASRPSRKPSMPAVPPPITAPHRPRILVPAF